jgi:fibronectin type 3 domain-containing protein
MPNLRLGGWVHSVPLAMLLLFTGCGRFRDTTPRAKAADPHSVTIRWIASKSKVAGYNVYRLSPVDVPVKLTHEIVSGTEFTDKTAEAGHTYSYFVTAVDSKGQESRPSEKVDVTVPKTAVSTAAQ